MIRVARKGETVYAHWIIPEPDLRPMFAEYAEVPSEPPFQVCLTRLPAVVCDCGRVLIDER